MGMRISGSSGTAQSLSMSNWQQRQQNSKALFASLQAGDLGAAQKAFSDLSGNNGMVNSSSPLAQIGQALQSGDMAGAQKAAQQLQASRNAGGNHQLHRDQQQALSGATKPAQPTSGAGSLLNVTA